MLDIRPHRILCLVISLQCFTGSKNSPNSDLCMHLNRSGPNNMLDVRPGRILQLAFIMFLSLRRGSTKFGKIFLGFTSHLMISTRISGSITTWT